MSTNNGKERERMVDQRIREDGMNVSPPAPSNVRPSTPPPAPPKAPSR